MNQKSSRWVGILTGFANGLFGSGGGTIVVPCMQRFLGISTHKSHATAIAVILPLSVLSLGIYIWKTEILWETALWASGGGILGGYLGAKWLKKLSPCWLHIIFGGMMLLAGVRMVI